MKNLSIIKSKALFLDRDGVINYDYGHVYKIDDFHFIEGIFSLCRAFAKCGYKIIIITNQAGIGKAMYKESDFLTLNAWMINEFKKEGIEITDTFYCPHKPEQDCECRKPKPGLILKAINKYNIDPLSSILIGDKDSDIIAGKVSNIGTLFKVGFDKTINQPKLADFQQVFNYLRSITND